MFYLRVHFAFLGCAENAKMQTIKCVVVGDGAVGKTCLLISYTTNKFPSEYVPTVFDNYAVTVMIGGDPYTLGLFDTAGEIPSQILNYFLRNECEILSLFLFTMFNNLTLLSIVSFFRSGRLWQVTSFKLSSNWCLSCVFFGCVAIIIWKCKRKGNTLYASIIYRQVLTQILTFWHLSYLQWVPEITHHCQRTPFLLVGTQIDLRDDVATVEKLAKNKQKPISAEQGEKLAKELKAVKYVECSALTQVGRSQFYICQRAYH